MKTYKIKFSHTGKGMIVPQISNLGKLIGMFCKIEADCICSHEDVSAWSAPSECHGDVNRDYNNRLQEFEESLSKEGISLKLLKNVGKDRNINLAKAIDECVGRIYFRNSMFTNM